jgi:hypothetical protein
LYVKAWLIGKIVYPLPLLIGVVIMTAQFNKRGIEPRWFEVRKQAIQVTMRLSHLSIEDSQHDCLAHNNSDSYLG